MWDLVPVYVLTALGFLLAAAGVKLAYDSKREVMAGMATLKSIASPQQLGDALHHAIMKNDGEIMQEAGEHMNGIVADAIPLFSSKLAEEAMGALGSMYSSGVAKQLGKSSGAARGYLNLSGIGKQAVKQGAEGVLGGALGGLLPEGIDIGSLISMFMASKGAGGGNGGQQAQHSHQTQWRPPI